jgi:hypothetical protein
VQKKECSRKRGAPAEVRMLKQDELALIEIIPNIELYLFFL